MTIRIDYVRARAVVETAQRAYRAREYPYQNIRLPQDEIAAALRQDPLVFARLLFYSCLYMRGTIKSGFAMRQISAMAAVWPNLFNPYLAKDLAVCDIAAFLRRYIPYRSGDIAAYWKENSRRLVLYWDGDPRMIFRTARTPGRVYRFVTNRESVRIRSRTREFREDGFLGFQKKMAGMLAYFLESCGLIAPLKQEIQPPVDFHHIRIARATRMIVTPGTMKAARYETLFPVVMRLYAWLMRETGIGMRELGDLFWIVSERLCSDSPATDSQSDVPVTPDWDDIATRERYHRTCGECPLGQYCDYAVPAATYYKAGYFMLQEPRPRYPHPDHLFRGSAVFPPKKSGRRPEPKGFGDERQATFDFVEREQTKDPGA